MSKYDNEIQLLEAEIEAKRKQLSEFKQQRAEEECPFKVGDIVDTCGYSYKGSKMVVDKIKSSGRWNWRKSSWAVFGRVLKADGTPGKNTTDFDEYDYIERTNAAQKQ